MLFQMIWRPIVGGASDPDDVTPCESEDAAMADLHEFCLGLRISVFCRINGRAGLSRVSTAAFATDEAAAIAHGADIIIRSLESRVVKM